MYSRNYYDEGAQAVTLPENYMGTAFSEGAPDGSDTNITEPPSDIPEQGDTQCSAHPQGRDRPSFLSGLFGDNTPSFFKNLRLPELGLEEILIIATAAFLFFSKDGDRECAIMLILLLLVN